MLAVGANSTAIMAALPSMQMELSLSSAGVQWAVNAYLVASAACIVLGGRAGDRFGARLRDGWDGGVRRRVVHHCPLRRAGCPSDRTEPCRVSRGRSLYPALLPRSTLASRRRVGPKGSRAWTGSLMLGFSVGPLVGGALTDVTGWRAIFWLNALLMLAAMAGLARGELGGDDPEGKRGRRVDWTGFILQATFMVALIFGLHGPPQARAAPLPVVGPWRWRRGRSSCCSRRRRASPRRSSTESYFLRTDFVMGLAMGSLAMFSIMSLLLYYNLYAQSPQGLALGALEAGASPLPLSAALFAVALTASATTARVGLGAAITGAMALIVVACAILGAAVSGGGSLMLAIGFVTMGAGLALPYASAPRLALSALSPAEKGQGSGLVNACTFLGGSFGVAGAPSLSRSVICRGSGDDRGRRPDRRRARPLNSKGRIAPDTFSASRANMGAQARGARPRRPPCRTCRGARRAAFRPGRCRE